MGAAKSSCLKPQNDWSLETSKPPPPPSDTPPPSRSNFLILPKLLPTGDQVCPRPTGTSHSSLHSQANYLSWTMQYALVHIIWAQRSFPERPPHPPIVLPLSRSLEGLTLIQCPPEVANSLSQLLRSPRCAE